jgi:hypothetical protein
LHPTPLLLFPFPSCSLFHYPSFSLLSFPPSPVSIPLLLSSLYLLHPSPVFIPLLLSSFSLSKLHHHFFFSSVPFSLSSSPSFFSLHPTPLLWFPSLSCSVFHYPSFSHLFSPSFTSLYPPSLVFLVCITLFFSSVPFSLPCSPSFFSLHPTLLLLFPSPHAPFSIIPPYTFSLSLLDESPSTFYCLLSPSLNCITLYFLFCSFLPSLFSLLL